MTYTIVLDENHRYWKCTSDGRRIPVPGVSHILKTMGVDRGYYTRDNFYATRGSFVHKAAELESRGVLDENSVDPEIAPYLSVLRQFDQMNAVEVLVSEKVVYSEEYDYCGRLDRVCTMRWHENPVLLDLKTGSVREWHVLQLCAYLLAYMGDRWGECDAGCLYLRKTGYTLSIMDVATIDQKMLAWKALVRKYHERAGDAIWVEEGT